MVNQYMGYWGTKYVFSRNSTGRAVIFQTVWSAFSETITNWGARSMTDIL